MGALTGLNELLLQATGKALDVADFEAHLTRRYLPD
jgi:Zn-dependent M32 family carboxypeptidase